MQRTHFYQLTKIARRSLFVWAMLLIASLSHVCYGDTTWVSGQTGGVWTAEGSPYVITDSSWILAADSLIVLSGVEILFPNQDSRLMLKGKASFQGQEGDSIRLIMDWPEKVIRSDRSITYRIEFDYCVFEGQGRHYIGADSIFIQHCAYRTSNISSYIPNHIVSNGQSGGYLSITDCHLQHFSGIETKTVLKRITFEKQLDFGFSVIVVADSIIALPVDIVEAGVMNLIITHQVSPLELINSKLDYLYIDYSFGSPNSEVAVRKSEFAERVRIEYSGGFEIDDCRIKELRINRSSGSVHGCRLMKLHPSDMEGLLEVYNNNFIWKECCAPLFGDDFINTSFDDFEMILRNNIFYSLNPDVNIFRLTTEPPNVIPEYNLIYGMDEPWQIVSPGTGNLDADPLFVPNSDYSELRYDSPAIDTGDPAFADPDGSVSDIGTFWWDHRYDHPPVIAMPDTIETRWGDRFKLTLSLTDDGTIMPPRISRLPRWLYNRMNLDETENWTLFAGTVPFGVSSFDIDLEIFDDIGQSDLELIHVEIHPSSDLVDTLRGTLPVIYSPYRMNRDIIIPANDSLLIESGVTIQVEFIECPPSLVVRGRLIADGAEGDTIRFTSLAGHYWNGIWIRDSLASAIIRYTTFEDAFHPIWTIYANRVELDNCRFSQDIFSDMEAIRAGGLHDSLVVKNCLFTDSSSLTITSSCFRLDSCIFSTTMPEVTTILVGNGDESGYIMNCLFDNMLGQSIILQSGGMIVTRCIFKNSNAEKCVSVGYNALGLETARIEHCTFVNNNGLAVFFAGWSRVMARNNIFLETAGPVFRLSQYADTNEIQLSHNCIWNYDSLFMSGRSSVDWPVIGTMMSVNANGDSTDLYGNIIMDPLLIENTYELSEDSPCIDAGFDYGQEYWGTAPDMGYREYTVETIRHIEHDSDSDEAFDFSIFPNPANEVMTICFNLSQSELVKLNVFDVTGRLVSSLIDNYMTAGQHDMMFDGSGLASGIYFARMEAGNRTTTRKMVLLK